MERRKKVKKFWNWKQGTKEDRTLFLNGAIAEESWFDDEVTPAFFQKELGEGEGDLTVWINSPGGDCIAAARIYNMLRNYKGHVTVNIDGIAASAASVIAMAGSKVIMSPVSMLMIHNPMTIAFGEKSDMKRAMAMLDEVKESILNAYEIKTGMEREKLATLMDKETWMNVHSAMELGFVDEMMTSDGSLEHDGKASAMLYKRVETTNCLLNKVSRPSNERKVEELYHRLELIKKHI